MNGYNEAYRLRKDIQFLIENNSVDALQKEYQLTIVNVKTFQKLPDRTVQNHI